MRFLSIALALSIHLALFADFAAARSWTDKSGEYELEADLISFDDEFVVLRRADKELAALAIADLSDVAGKWDGLIRVVPHQRRDDWVTVMIAPDGKFEFSSLRTIGVFTGRGEFALNDGKLFSKSERGTIEAALYQYGNQRLLKAKGRAADGAEYTAEVKPAK